MSAPRKVTVPLSDRKALTIAETAGVLGLSYGAVTALIARGELPAVDVSEDGRKAKRIVPVVDIDAYLAARKTRSTAAA